MNITIVISSIIMKRLVILWCFCALCQVRCDGAEQPSSTATQTGDLLQDNLTWSCANNASCVTVLTTEVINRLRSHKPIELAGIRVEPLVTDDGGRVEEARALSFMDVISDNALKIPLGPMMISVQRSKRYDDYLELALLKKDQTENGKQMSRVNRIYLAVWDFIWKMTIPLRL